MSLGTSAESIEEASELGHPLKSYHSQTRKNTFDVQSSQIDHFRRSPFVLTDDDRAVVRQRVNQKPAKVKAAGGLGR